MTQEIALSPRGLMRPATISEAMDYAKMIAGSGMVPTAYRGKPADILIAIQMGAELGFAPMQSLRGIAVINGQPSVYGDAAIALVRGSGLCEEISETIEGSGDAAAAVCVARRKGQASPIVGRFSVADAKKAGLWGKVGPWQSYPTRMLVMRARGFCLRDGFADVLRGIITAEEAHDYPTTEPRDITPQSAVVAALDAFAAEPVVESAIDPEFMALADSKADAGCDAFRAWWKTLSQNNRATLLPYLDALKGRAEKADAAQEPEAEDDPFGLPPIEQHQPPVSADRPAGPDPSPEMPDHSPLSGAPPAAVNTASPEGRAEAGTGGAALASGRLPPATSSAPIVEAVMRGTGPRRTMDVEATLKALVAAFLELETFGSCNLFRIRNRATINMLPEDEREGFEIAAKAHEQQLVEET